MQCQRCGDNIDPGDVREHYGRRLCEDCYMDALSPARACDPWAIHTAKSFDGLETNQLNPIQTKILNILKEGGEIELPHLVERLNIKPTNLDRELATLRHMQKIRGRLYQGKRYILPW